MFGSFVIMLREGVEVALVVAILLLTLKRTGLDALGRAVWWGVGLAALASVAAAVALTRLPLNEEAYEGALYWTAAAFVVSMMVWMHSRARRMRAEAEAQVRRAAAGRGAAWALGAFAFLMVFREGAEAVLLLAAVNLTTSGMLSFLGAVLGLAAAVAFGVLFVRGSLRVDLGRFFRVTNAVLGIFAAQLLINGYHEFSEVGLVPSSRTSMAIVGPLVRHNTLFVLALVALPLFIWLSRARPASPAPSASPAEVRLALARQRRERRARWAAAAAALTLLATLGVVYAREAVPKRLSPPEPVRIDGGEAVVPEATLADGHLHRFGVLHGGRLVRFIVLRTDDGRIRSGFDACEICGAFGYREEEGQLVCLNCTAAINPRTIGEMGGCNPIPLASRVEAGLLRVPLEALVSQAWRFEALTGLVEIDPVCGMRVRLDEAAAFATHGGHSYYFCSERCRQAFAARPAAHLAGGR